ESCRHRGTIPAGLTCWRRRFQDSQHLVAEVRAINRLGAGSWRIAQPGQPALHKALAPLDNGVGAGAALLGNLLHALSVQTTQNNASSFHHLFSFRPTGRPPLQGLLILWTTGNLRCSS